jgi:hypothetical protein
VTKAPEAPAPAPAPAEDVVVVEEDLAEEPTPTPVAKTRPEPAPTAQDAGLLDELVEEGMADSDEFERGLQEILDDDTTGGAAATVTTPAPTAPASDRPEPVLTVAEQIAAASRAEAKGAELTAAGLVKRTPKKRADSAVGGGMPTTQAPRATGQTQRSPEEVRKMLSRYRSGLNKGRNGADSEKTDS